MSTQTAPLSLSDTGLRLIKAFEGYRPVDRELVTGARVVGYGHRVSSPEPVSMSQSEAEDTLRLDLEAYEELINEEVHAPLSQGQFDALCSLAFNIGPRAFRSSDTVRALNNGRVLDAANGFDIWRKANIDGKTYVVDALMRRRAAEKCLFLKTGRTTPAPRDLLEPKPDIDAISITTEDGLPVFTDDDRNGIVAKAPYEAVPNPRRRRDDDPVGILTLSEIIEPEPVGAEVVEFDALTPDDDALMLDAQDIVDADSDTDILSEAVEEYPGEPKLSIISEAADALGSRLDALIDDIGDTDRAEDKTEADWPTSLIKPIDDANTVDVSRGAAAPTPVAPETPKGATVDTARSNLVAFPGQILTAEDVPDEGATLVIDELARDDAIRNSRVQRDFDRTEPKPSASNDTGFDVHAEPTPESGLWIPGALGFGLFGGAVVLLWRGAEQLLGPWGPVIAAGAAILGALMVLFALYLAVRGNTER